MNQDHKLFKFISLSAIAKDYFHKPRGWLYKRLFEKPYDSHPSLNHYLTDEDKEKLAKAFEEIANMLNESAEVLRKSKKALN